MPLHPTGSSQKITVSNGIPQTVEMSGLPDDKRVLRIVTMTYPTKGVMFVCLGDQDAVVTNATGMPLESGALKEQLIAVGDETHIAILMMGNATYDVIVTPGEIV